MLVAAARTRTGPLAVAPSTSNTGSMVSTSDTPLLHIAAAGPVYACSVRVPACSNLCPSQ